MDDEYNNLERHQHTAVKFPRPYSVTRCASLAKETSELCGSSPLLFWLAVRHSISQDWKDKRLVRLSTKTRVEILTLVSDSSDPVERSAVKFIEKLRYQRIASGDSGRLLKSISSGNYKSLLHHKYPSIQLINIAYLCPEIVNAQWIKNSEIMKNDPGKALGVIMDMLSMALDMSCVAETTGKLNRKSKWEKIVEYHDELVSEFNAAIDTELFISFPSPPIEGADSIIPITDSVLLAQEAIKQDNCVYSYMNEIVEGRYYVYQVCFEYDRATLGLYIDPNGEIHIDQLLAGKNHEVTVATRQLVYRWFENRNTVLPRQRFMAEYKERQNDEIMQCYQDLNSRGSLRA